jgi:hypothetical protein
MILNEIFAKDVQRPIEGVIKADDAANLANEVEEYVLTNEAAKELEKLLEDYTSPSTGNGVWISGFFGSGKSHMLKMLAHLLGDVEGQAFPREQVSEAFRTKSVDQFLPGLLNKADKIPAKSLLFNIDQKAAVITKDETDALLKVFVKVFDDMRGYFGTQGHVARFERDLDAGGQYLAFQTAFEQLTGKSWIDERKNFIIRGPQVDRAYAEVVNGTAPTEILKQYASTYEVSIEGFADEVTEWIENQPAGTRLNFFVDEVGQFIGDDTKLMLNLQTIAESLNSRAKGRSWVFVTSQEDMDKIIGDQTKKQAQDFSKIQGRFKARVKLTSQDVEEVIRKRLLEKNDTGLAALQAVYNVESANFKTLFEFADGAKTYKNYTSQDLFIGTYPFVTYQFPLFQQAIEGLSEHNAFEGRNTAVGERSMLGVVQQVAKELDAAEIGTLASFDRMFAGIRSSLKSAPQKQVQLAEQNLDDKLAVRVLKALFLVKYVDGFKATVRNLTVLVYDRFGLDLPALQDEVRGALALLEQQTYIQRSGDVYSYLTNEEQDIEKEIKGVDVDSSEVTDYLFQKLLYVHVMKQQTKFRYAKTNQDFPIGYMLDDVAKGQPKELTVHFITPANPNELTNIHLQGAGKSELRIVLGADSRLLSDLTLLLKTAKYVKQKQGTAITDSVRRILDLKSQESATHEKALAERVRESVGKATLIVDTVEVASSATVAEARIADGMSVLVAKTYPQLDMLGGKSFPETDISKYVQSDDGTLGTLGGELETPSDEIYKQGVLQRDKLGEQVTVKKLVDQFQVKPYGWDYGSILCTVAYLYGKGKLTLELDAVILKRTEVAQQLRNSQKHASLIIRKQATFDQSKVKVFSDFVKEFFDEANPPKEPTELAQHGADRLKATLEQLKNSVATSRYPFTSALQGPIDLLEAVVGKSPTWYVSEFVGGDELIDAKNDILVPVEQFIKGPQAEIFDGAQKYLQEAQSNLSYLPPDAAAAAAALLADPAIFRGNKANLLKTAVDELRTKLETLVADDRTKAIAAIRARGTEIQETEYFQSATPGAQQQALGDIDAEVSVLDHESSIAKLRLAPRTFAQTTLPRLLHELAAAKPAGPSSALEPTGAAPGTGGVDYGPTPPQPASTPLFIPMEQVRVEGGKKVLSSVADVDEYVEALRAALNAAINEGKRITR